MRLPPSLRLIYSTAYRKFFRSRLAIGEDRVTQHRGLLTPHHSSIILSTVPLHLGQGQRESVSLTVGRHGGVPSARDRGAADGPYLRDGSGFPIALSSVNA